MRTIPRKAGVTMAVANEGPGSQAGQSRTAQAIKPIPGGNSLYESYQKVHPRRISGTYRSIKWWMMGLLLTIFWVGPWLRWDRGPSVSDQAIFIDLPGRRAYFFFIEIWPQEIYYLTGLLIIAAVGLFFATALLGRVWCGFACFQTVFTDLFVAVERLIEGDRNSRIKRDGSPMTADTLMRKTLKTVIWVLISLAVGIGFILYFYPAPWPAIVDIVTFNAGVAAYGTLAVVGGGCLIMAGYAREQVCLYMCPYARFQSAMVDEDSMIVTYEKWRGEPRGKYSRDADFSQRGDCVDCGLCVQVCPTGVDIREGTQLGCIGCGLCVDACNSVMTRFGLPPNLIAYDSVTNQNARAEGSSRRIRLIRPRTLVYSALLLVVIGAMAVSLATRSRLDISVLHERSPLFVTMSDGSVRNGYTFKVLNMERVDNAFSLTTTGIAGATIEIVGVTKGPVTEANLPVAGDKVGTFRLYVSAPRASLPAPTNDISFVLINSATGQTQTYKSLFAGPR
ncbi:cytochrome c oxidase accessory protein CcoG [Rhodospirillum rubrum]|nr:cytochrome c oxidase accessory protein CcoG [Rhodospirillum rubrum]MBK1676241.1 cytochrome c oxidase accessory protein CcoG [Rhodospirillum rubrum]